ncbi:MAG TPA: glycosyltransferase family 4 protein [Holophagaceae bacterium]|jgi:GalNAc-alpha-(1->4)-GalNAc-alpha-(1->3)-diNAcBac-PP-undecaprenol alpha-1,4-N-acetyl-D-galactosaminyltransferase|nr:glycosyltransferase family 4 protein [Holophagaceae bacterium]
MGDPGRAAGPAGKDRLKVCFFIWGLRAAGAERVLSFLANAWSAKGWQVVILTMEDGKTEPFYPLADAVEVRTLDLLKDSASFVSGLTNNLRRLRTIRRAFREAAPDVAISFVDKANTLAVFASRGLGIPLIISERTDPSRRSLGRWWSALRDRAYPRADILVFQSQAVLDWFPPRVRRKGVVIPNPVLPPPDADPSPREDRPRRIVAMGRLFPVKGFDLLLEAFAAAAAKAPDWVLDIWGEGPERSALEEQARRLGLGGRVRFPGLTERPFEILRSADLFILSSRAEGFPNVLVEAMACGLPVISTDFGGAAKEIIRDGVDGVLVPSGDPSALASAMLRLMSDPAARARLSQRAPEVVARYSRERILALWEQAIGRALGAGGGDACRT